MSFIYFKLVGNKISFSRFCVKCFYFLASVIRCLALACFIYHYSRLGREAKRCYSALVLTITKARNSAKNFLVRSLVPTLVTYLTKLTILMNECRCWLSGIVYLESSNKNYKKGWYMYNDLWNEGKSTFVGLVHSLKKEGLCLLIIEKVRA